MTKKWRRWKCTHCGLPICLPANWPRKFARANCRLTPFGLPVRERLRSTDFWMALVRLCVTDALCESIFWRSPVVMLRPPTDLLFWMCTDLLALTRGDESCRCRGLTLRGELRCILGAEWKDGAERMAGAA